MTTPVNVSMEQILSPQDTEEVKELFETAVNSPVHVLPTPGQARELAAWKEGKAPVVSLYLDLGPERRARGGWEAAVKDLLRKTREAGGPAVENEVSRLETVLLADPPPTQARGLALFTCGAEGLWRMFTLPIQVDDRVHVGPRPYVRPLVRAIDEHEQALVVLASEARSRVALTQAGLCQELLTIEGLKIREVCSDRWDPRRYLTRDERDRLKTELRHSEAKALAHVVEALARQLGVEHILLGASPAFRGALLEHLDPQVRGRVEPEPFPLLLEASPEELAKRALEASRAIEAREEARTLSRIEEEGVLGADPVLQALHNRNVRTLAVACGFTEPGGRCAACGRLRAGEGPCPTCGAAVERVEDVWDLAMEEALVQAASIEIVQSEPAKGRLASLGGAGALPRY
ncbi:baeRF10 domain-containing protein [Deferrisoma sp.]